MAEGEAASTQGRTLGKSGLSADWKLAGTPATQLPMQPCPLCNSPKLSRDGLRSLADGRTTQRWLCRSCGYRFSQSSVKVNVNRKAFASAHAGDNHHQIRVVSGKFAVKKTSDDKSLSWRENVSSHGLTTVEKQLNRLPFNSSNCQVCATRKGAKNLDSTTAQTETVSGTSTPFDAKTAKGLLLQYTLYLQKEGYGLDCRYKSCIRMLINSGANLLDPENVKEVIAKKGWKDGTKMQTAYAYDALLKMLKLSWSMPRYRQEEAFPFIPEEKELDALIAGAGSQRMSTYLQTLKETLTDPSEALRLKWIDIKGNVITINKPVKGHYPRHIEVSNSLISTLNALPKTSEYMFPTTYRNLARCYYMVRRKLVKKLNNPRLMSISLVTFRHWGATMLYHHSHDILLVKKLLGHKNINSTMKYTQLVDFKDDDYEVTTASTEEEIKTLGRAGFMKYDEQNGIHFYRKPKRFVSLA